MPPLDPDVADLAPSGAALTDYDEEHVVTYVRMLDADAEGADWREVSRIVLHILIAHGGHSKVISREQNGQQGSDTDNCFVETGRSSEEKVAPAQGANMRRGHRPVGIHVQLRCWLSNRSKEMIVHLWTELNGDLALTYMKLKSRGTTELTQLAPLRGSPRHGGAFSC